MRYWCCRSDVSANFFISKFIAVLKIHIAYRRLKSATIAMQCAARRNAAIHIYEALVKEQKDIGNLKEQNENLKTEMQSLKAMLAVVTKSIICMSFRFIKMAFSWG